MKRVFLLLFFLCLGTVFLAAQNTDWDLTKLDTARKSTYLSRQEQDIILELNKVRSDPSRYAELYIKPRLGYFNGLRYNDPAALPVSTKEGRKAVEECYDALSKMAPVPVLYPREGLLRAASDHSRDMSRNKIQGHTGSDGSSPNDRAARFGRGTAAESTAYGFYLTMQEFVREMLIDDGTPSRQHRDTFMNKDYSYVGISMADSMEYTNVFVILFSQFYASFNNAEEERELEAKLAAALNNRSGQDSANWDPVCFAPVRGITLDTAFDVSTLSGIEKDLVLEVNIFRSDPKKYARLYLAPNSPGYNAIVNSTISPLYRLSLDKGLCLGAKDLNGGPAARANRYGDLLDGTIVEAVARGYFKSGREAVIQLLNSTSREYLATDYYGHFGVSVRLDPAYGLAVLIEFAEAYRSN